MTIDIPEELKKHEAHILSTQVDIISLNTHAKRADHLEHSKLGGLPYWPENIPYPLINDTPAIMIAQINFSQLSEQGITLENYPTQGILQFYCDPDDDVVGLDYDANAQGSSGIKVIYHENADAIPNVSQELIDIVDSGEYLPFDRELKLTFSKETEVLGCNDEYQQYKYLNLELNEEEQDALCEIYNGGSKLGGYAYFTQQDPRDDTFTQEDQWLLLLQLDSDDNMMWGDLGVANWFIRKQDLLDKRFDRVFFTFDCH